MRAEKDDFLENLGNDDHFIISGLAKIRSGLSTKEWQVQVQQDVSGIISLIINRSPKIEVIHNQTGAKQVTSYLVKMADAKDAVEIRSKFGRFFAGGGDTRPHALKQISIGNFVTPATKVRIAVLKVMAERYRSSNPGSRAQVVGYAARPLIRLIPPQDASDRRIKTLNYIEAVRTLPINFTPEQYSTIMSRVNPKLYKSLRSLFVVLHDDLPKVHRPRQPRVNGYQSQSDASEADAQVQPDQPEPASARSSNKRPHANPSSGDTLSKSSRSSRNQSR